MYVGRARAELRLPAGGSLKDKRRSIKGVLTRLRNRHEVAAAEVARQDDHHRAALGVAAVSGDRRHLLAQLAKVEAYLAALPEAILLEFEVEVV